MNFTLLTDPEEKLIKGVKHIMWVPEVEFRPATIPEREMWERIKVLETKLREGGLEQ